MKKATKLSVLTFLVAILSISLSHAQITLDGVSDEPEYETLATANSNDGFGSSNNIDNLKYYADGNFIYIGIPADLDNNNNVAIWVDFSGYGGTPAGDVVGEAGAAGFFSNANFDGAIMDFEVDFAIAMNEGFSTDNFYMDAVRYGSTGGILSSAYQGNLGNQNGTSGSLPDSDKTSIFAESTFEVSYLNTGGSDEGLELRIDISNIPGVDSTNTVRLFAAVVAGDGFMSNEVLPNDFYTGGNPGSDVNFGTLAVGDFFTEAQSLQHSVEISGDAGWRLLSIPKTGATGADISDDGIGAQFTTDSDSATIYTYDDTGSFEAISSDATSLTDGHGLAVYFFDNTTAGSTELPITLDASGTPPTSDVVVDLYSGATGRYTLVGNPFSSNVDLANVLANIAISSNMTFWDDAAGSYTTENISGGLVIEPWQGYWVQTGAATAGGQLTFGTADKTSSEADTTHFDKVNPNTVKELRFTIESSYNTEKNLTLQVADDAYEGWDTYDLLKLNSLLTQNISAAFVGELEGESVLKGIEAIPTSLEREITIPIMVDLKGDSQTLNMSWSGVSELPDTWALTLYDYVTEESFDLRSANNYDFEVIVNGSNEKVNPITILSSPLGQKMKLKSEQTPRFGITITPSTTSVSNEPGSEVDGFALAQNYPNPFNPTTTINYSVENSGAVMLSVYNLMGQKVAELVNETKASGSYNVTWNASQAASGMYYYRLEAGGQVLIRKMTLIK
ncbi:MAG: hypothetical protein BalsKO_07030 [Balneolaceae bacterium]